MPAAAGGYSAVIYSTTDGRIKAELPLADDPDWTAEVNGDGTWSATTVIGDPSGPKVEDLRALTVGARFSVAILWGEFVVQAGPITAYDVDDQGALLKLGGPGLWGLLNRRLLTNPAWNPATSFITGTQADTTLTDSLPNIARTLIRNAVSMTYRPGSALPLDVPANVGSGTNTRFYPGYDLISVGQRLHELTQVDNGPDVLIHPYKVVGDNVIRHRAYVGTPDLVQAGDPVAFDYGSSLESLAIEGDGSNVATGSWIKGSGQERLTQYARMESTRLTDQGWPIQDYVDTGHSSTELQQATLDGWATANLALYGGSIETWKAVVRVNEQAPLDGTYLPGYRVKLNFAGDAHPWIVNGQYLSRILGMAKGPTTGTVSLTLEQRGGVF